MENKEFETLLEYEIAGSRFASLIFWDWGQNLMAKYYAKKTLRKYLKYQELVRLKK